MELTMNDFRTARCGFSHEATGRRARGFAASDSRRDTTCQGAEPHALQRRNERSTVRLIPRAPHPTLYGDFFVKWKSARLSLFGMGRGSARGPLLAVEVLAARTVDGPNPCQGRSRWRRWPKASLYKGWVHRRQSGAGFTPASGLVFHPILRAEGKGWREAERVRRGAVGYALLVWIFDGFARDCDVRGREGDHGFGEARIRGELYRGRQDHRATALYSVGLATRTMMHSCASAAKFLGGGTILSLGAKAMARCGSRRLGSLPARAKARSPREKKLLFGKGLGKPRRLSSPGV